MQSTFMFYGKPIQAVAHNGEFYVSVRHICEGIGFSNPIDQYNKLKANEGVFSCRAIPMTGSDSKQYQMLCIPLSRLNLWLCGISPSKVKPEIRAELIKYQCECADVLYRHFLQKEPTWDLEGFVAQVKEQIAEMDKRFTKKIEDLQKQLQDATSTLRVMFGEDTPVIVSLIQEVSELEGVDGREVWGDVQTVLDVQSYKRMNRRIINYLKNRKDGSGLKLVQPT